jgi:hypothetical protein
MVMIEPIDATYRRRIEVRPGPLVVEAAMEDYIHHFAIRLHHDGTKVTAVDIAPERVPWSTCPEGAIGVRRLVGIDLDEIADLGTWIGSRAEQCVHTVDLAVVAAAAAIRGTDRTYEFVMTGIGHSERIATLLVDGEPWATWVIVTETVIDPSRSGRFAGLPLDRVGFSRWMIANLEPEETEPAAVMRRASSIGLGRGLDIDSWSDPAVARPGDDSCHTYRPAVVEVALRNLGSQRETDAEPVGTPIRPARHWLDGSR